MYHMSMSGDAAKPVSCYAEAQRNLAAAQLTPTGRRKREKDYGWECGSSVTRIRQSGDAIIFRLYATDVVTWRPDESFEIDNWDSQLTAQFIRNFTPVSASGDRTLTYFPPQEIDPNDWRGRWAGARTVRGDVRFELVEGYHQPDLDTCDTFRFLAVTDRAATRRVSAEHNLAAFRNWLVMAPMMLDVEHEGTGDVEACATALREKRFVDALRVYPTTEIVRGFDMARRVKPIPVKGLYRDRVLTMTGLERVRDHIYEDAGLLEVVERKVMTQGELDRMNKRNAAYAKANVGYRLGWSSF